MGEWDNFRDSLVQLQCFFFPLHFCHFFLSWFSDCPVYCLWCPFSLSFYYESWLWVSHMHVHVLSRSEEFVYELHSFICFSYFPPSMNLFSEIPLGAESGVHFTRNFEKLSSRWLSLLCVLSPIFRWGRGAVLPWKPWAPLCMWLRLTPSVLSKPGKGTKGDVPFPLHRHLACDLVAASRNGLVNTHFNLERPRSWKRLPLTVSTCFSEIKELCSERTKTIREAKI